MSVTPSSPMQASPPVRAVRPSADIRWMLLLAALAAVSRLWLLGGDPGEADCARFLIGLRRWAQFGPHAPAMYGSVFSPLYYWLAAHLTHGFGIEPLRAARLLSGLSAVAAIATAPVAYALGCRLVSSRIAFWATLAFLATPALWWLGIEPHPQGLSLLGFLLALLCLAIRLQDAPSAGRARLLMLASIAALTFGLGCKSDLILFFGAFPALLPALRPDLFPAFAGSETTWRHDGRRGATAPNLLAAPPPHERSSWGPRPVGRCGRASLAGEGRALRSARLRVAAGWRPALSSALLMPVMASLLFLLLRSLILRHSFAWLQHNSDHVVAAFLEWPRGGRLIKQLLPMTTAFGAMIALITGTGIVRAVFRRRSELWRLSLLVGMWSLPSVLFWFLIRGNNVRHMADILLPLLWLGLAGWEGLRWPVIPTWIIAALLLDFWIIPPSSNLTLYPSANVPESAHDLHLRIEDLRDNLADEGAGTQLPVCYLGNATLPYLELLLWNAHPGATLTSQNDTLTLNMADGRRVHFIEVNSSSEYRQAAAGCPRARSLEYEPNGAHQWFFGQEWASLPFHRRWYAVRYERGR